MTFIESKTPEKRILVGYEGKKKKKSGDKISQMMLCKKLECHWFCPKCKKVMKKKIR